METEPDESSLIGFVLLLVTTLVAEMWFLVISVVVEVDSPLGVPVVFVLCVLSVLLELTCRPKSL